MARKKHRRDSGTGSIYKDGTGYRVALMIGADPKTGKPLYRKFRASNHEEAVETLNRMQSDLRAGLLTKAQGTSFADFITHWLEHKVRALRAPSTYRQYEWVVREHLLPLLGKKKLDQLNRTDIQALIASKAKQKAQPRAKQPAEPSTKNLSRYTLNAIRVVLHSAFQDAIRDGLAPKNPADYIELPKAPKVAAVFLTPNQAAALMAKAKGSDIPELLTFLLSTGCRIGEALGVRWQDIDLPNRRVTICGQLQRIESKLTRLESTKTNQVRTLALSTSLTDQLQQLKSRQLVEGWSDPDGLAFLNIYGRRFDPKFVSQKIKALCKLAEVPEVSPHKLRHTAATLALAETGDLHAVQKMLGHQQVALTANLYGHATAEILRPLSDAIERALNLGSD